MNIRIVFLLVIILWWNLDVVEPLMAMITIFVFFWIFVCCVWWCWWVGLSIFLVVLVCIYVWSCFCLGEIVFLGECVCLCIYLSILYVLCLILFSLFLCVGDDSRLPMRTLWDLGVGVGSSSPLLFLFLWNFHYFCVTFFIFPPFCINFSFPFEFRGVLYYLDQS